jgi:ATP phosphoribosyltransferase
MPSASNGNNNNNGGKDDKHEQSADELMKNLMQIRRKQKIRLSVPQHNTPDLNETALAPSVSNSSQSATMKDLTSQLKSMIQCWMWLFYLIN